MALGVEKSPVPLKMVNTKNDTISPAQPCYTVGLKLKYHTANINEYIYVVSFELSKIVCNNIVVIRAVLYCAMLFALYSAPH